MLVLSRRAGEKIMVGDKIEITILSLKADRVRIGIVAPPGVPVHRKEVHDEIRSANRDASTVQPGDAVKRTLGGPRPSKDPEKPQPPGPSGR